MASSEKSVIEYTVRLPRKVTSRVMAVILGTLVALLVAEATARVLIRYRWAPARIEVMTQHSSVKGSYTSHPYLPFVLTPNYESHNSYGFRGKDFKIAKQDGVKRVIAIGASTTYGIYVRSDETYTSQLEQSLSQNGIRAEVLNAGVPGYVSVDNLLHLQLRVLPLQPDVVIVYQGRNEMFPQAFTNFSLDYSHYRIGDYSFRTSNYLHKPLFRFSNLLMILASYRGDRFGWSWRAETPIYGSIRWENLPTSDQVIENLKDPNRNRVYRETVESMVSISKTRNITIILGTMAFVAERLATGVLRNDPAIYHALQDQVEENNKLVREIAKVHGVPLVDTGSLSSEPGLMIDDCHFNAKGHMRRAAMLYPAVLSAIMSKDH